MGEPVAEDPMAQLWQSSHELMRQQIAALEDAAVAVLEGRLTQADRANAAQQAHRLAESLGSFGLTGATVRARDADRMLAGVAELGPPAALRLSELVVDIENDFAGGPRLGGTATGDSTAHVLVIEADADAGRRILQACAALGLRPSYADSAAAGREQLANHRPDMVVVDPADPADPDGGRTLLEDLCLGIDPVPTLVVTAPGGKVDRAEAARLGTVGFLEKPIAPNALAMVVRTTLERRRSAFSVLVVGWASPVVDVVRDRLGRTGGQLTLVADPARLWHTLELVGPDLLLLQLDPGPTEQLGRMVRADPGWEHLPIVCVAPAVHSRELYRLGVDDVLMEDSTVDEIVERVTNRLVRARPRPRGDGDDDRSTGLDAWPRVERELERMLVMARRYGQPLMIGVLAVDRADQLDAEHGWRAGHAAELAFANLLRRSFRIEDVVGLRGSGQFVVALYGAEPGGAMARLASVLASFRDTPVAVEDRRFPATASAGLAQFPVHGNRVGALVGAATAAWAAAAAQGGDRLHTAQSDEAGLRHIDILIVDDDDTLVLMLTQALATQGYRVERMNDGADAVEALLAPDGVRARVILLDVDLPGLDGLSVLRELAQTDILKKTRVLIITVRSSERDILQALELGAYDHVAKPLSIPVLLHRVRQALRSGPG